jgi:hypothetical protein
MNQTITSTISPNLIRQLQKIPIKGKKRKLQKAFSNCNKLIGHIQKTTHEKLDTPHKTGSLFDEAVHEVLEHLQNPYTKINATVDCVDISYKYKLLRVSITTVNEKNVPITCISAYFDERGMTCLVPFAQ